MAAAPPRIGIERPGSGTTNGAVKLAVYFDEGQAEAVDVFRTAVAGGYLFDPAAHPWHLAATNLDPQGSNTLSWLDVTAWQDPARVYATGYTGQDGDADGLADAREILLYTTDPEVNDTDEDGLSDGDEVERTETDPLHADTDEDGLGDGWEDAYGLDPLDDGSTDPMQGADGNADGDALRNADEQALGTSPLTFDPVENLRPADLLVETKSVGGWLDTNATPAEAAYPCGDVGAVGWGTGVAYSVMSSLCTTGETAGMARRALAGDGVNTEIVRLAYRFSAATASGKVYRVAWADVFVSEDEPASPGYVEQTLTAFLLGNGGTVYIGQSGPSGPPGEVYPPLGGSAATSSFVIEPPASNGWMQLAFPWTDVTAYRPLIEGPGYGSPVQRAAVPDSAEEAPGAGIRLNGDIESASAENDLIEVELALPSYPPPFGLQFKLGRSAPQLRVWTAPTGQGPVLTTNDQAAITFTSQTSSVWVEHTGGAAAQLALTVEAVSAPGETLAEDRVRFYPFTSVVLALGGEGQVPTDPGDANHGVFRLALDLVEQGFDAHLYDEDLVSASGSGAVYDEIVSAAADRGVNQVALFGYSHGAGSIYHLTERMQDNVVTNIDVVYTAYVDSVRNNSDLDTAQELRRPVASLYHVNYYQEGSFFVDLGLDGGPTIDPPGADFEENRDDPTATETHYTVDDEPEVLSGIETRFLQRVTP